MKKIFGKGGAIDKATRDLDKAVADALGMENGAKPSHVFNSNSFKHKEAVKFFKGQEAITGPTTNNGSNEGAELESIYVAPGPVVLQAPVPEMSNSNMLKTIDNSATTTEPYKWEREPGEKIESTLAAEMASTAHNNATEITSLNVTSSSAMAQKDVEKVPESSRSVSSNDNGSKVFVWAKTLLEHKELTKTDKQGLPHFIKTEEEVTSLTNKIFELASAEQDSSYTSVAIDLVAEVHQFYSSEG